MWIMAKTYAEMKAEIATLTERVAALKEIVVLYKVMLDDLEEAFEAEKARSNIAVDRMLGEKGLPPITPVQAPTLEDLSSMFEESPEEAERIKMDINVRGLENVLLGDE